MALWLDRRLNCHRAISEIDSGVPGFESPSADAKRRLVVFHDERELRREWLYHGRLVVEASGSLRSNCLARSDGSR